MSRTEVTLKPASGGGGGETRPWVLWPLEAAFLDESASVKFPEDSIITVGYDGTNKGRGLIRFHPHDFTPGVHITSATLHIHLDYVEGTPTIELFHMLYPWRQENVTWLNGSNGWTWNSPGMGADFDYGTPAVASFSPVATGWQTIDVTDIVNDWIDSTWQIGCGLAFIDDDEATTNYVTIHGFPSSYQPYITITP